MRGVPLFSNVGLADFDFSPGRRRPPRLYTLLFKVADWSWSWSGGISIDQEGEVDGSGFMLRAETPVWLQRLLWKWAYRIEPEWLRLERKDDVSDALLASLLIRPAMSGLGIIPTFTVSNDVTGGSHSAPQTITWVDDYLQPHQSWRPE